MFAATVYCGGIESELRTGKRRREAGLLSRLKQSGEETGVQEQ